MYNYFMLIGRVIEEPTIEELEDGRRKAVIKIKVSRPFSIEKGEYVADVFNVTFCDFLIDYIREDLHREFPITVKGRMQSNEQGIELIGERIIFFEPSTGGIVE